MSGHTNRNRRNNGNPRSRHGPQRQRGPEGRANQSANQATGQPKNPAPGGARDAQSNEKEAQKSDQRQPHAPRPLDQPSVTHGSPESEQARDVAGSEAGGDVAASHEAKTPRGRPPFGTGSRGSHAYIPASGPRLLSEENGHNGTSGANGHTPMARQTESSGAASEYDDGEGDSAVPTPTNWRIERLNGGTDTTPREPFRPESRGEVGPLIDALHEMFAQDRTVASRGDSARCGICYLHFPLSALEYREAEGFYVCAGCQRALGRQQVMMIRRQQTQHGG